MAKAVFQMEAEDAGAVRALLKLVEAQRKVESETKKANRETKKQSNMLAGIGKYALSFASVGTALAGIKTVLGEVGRAGEQAARGVEALEDNLKRLIQISRSPQQFQRNLALAQNLSAQTGVGVGSVMDIVYEASNQGKLGQAGFYAQLERITDARQVMKGVSQVQNVFGAGAGTDPQLVNQLLTAAGVSDLSIEELAAATKRAAPAAKRIGASDEEVLGAVAALASPAGGGEMAATGIRAMATEASRSGFRGQGLDQAFQFFASMPKAQRDKILQGREEFAMGYTLYEQNRAAIQGAVSSQVQASELTGTPMGEVSRRFATLNEVPILRQMQDTQQAEARLANERMFGGMGGRGMERREAVAGNVQRISDEGYSDFTAAANELAGRGMSALGAPAGLIEATAKPGLMVLGDLVDALRENTRAMRGQGGISTQTE